MKRIRLHGNSALIRFAAVMLLGLALPFTVVLLLTAGRLRDMERQSAHQYLASNLRTVSATVDEALRNLEFSHTNIFMDSDFLSSIRRLAPYDSREEYSDFRDTNHIRSCISRVMATNAYIDSIYAYSFPAQRVFSSKTNWDPAFNHFTQAPWLDDAARAGRASPWVITREIRDGRFILSSYREVWTYGDESPVGLVSINVDSATVARMLGAVVPSSESHSFLMDPYGQIIGYEPHDETVERLRAVGKEGYFDFQSENGNMFVAYFTSEYSGFRYVIATPLHLIQTSVPVMTQLILLFLLLLLLLGILAMILVRHYFFSPTRALFEGMARVEAGDFSLRLPRNATREFGYINRAFNQMVESIDQLITENYANRLVNKEAQLRNMQNQLNEHFLYNTLDSIHWLARLEDAPQASEMVFALASFYRHSLSSGRDTIPVEEVVEMLRNYLFIQKVRLRDAMAYTLACDPAVSSQLLPKNAVQPLVENAILHGLKDLDRTGEIFVSFAASEGGMRVSVRDNGNGFTPEKLAQVRDQLEMKNTYCEHSFALKAVQSQLHIFCGTAIALHIETNQGQGTTVWFEMPLDAGRDTHCSK